MISFLEKLCVIVVIHFQLPPVSEEPILDAFQESQVVGSHETLMGDWQCYEPTSNR